MCRIFCSYLPPLSFLLLSSLILSYFLLFYIYFRLSIPVEFMSLLLACGTIIQITRNGYSRKFMTIQITESTKWLIYYYPDYMRDRYNLRFSTVIFYGHFFCAPSFLLGFSPLSLVVELVETQLSIRLTRVLAWVISSVANLLLKRLWLLLYCVFRRLCCFALTYKMYFSFLSKNNILKCKKYACFFFVNKLKISVYLWRYNFFRQSESKFVHIWISDIF